MVQRAAAEKANGGEQVIGMDEIALMLSIIDTVLIFVLFLWRCD